LNLNTDFAFLLLYPAMQWCISKVETKCVLKGKYNPTIQINKEANEIGGQIPIARRESERNGRVKRVNERKDYWTR